MFELVVDKTTMDVYVSGLCLVAGGKQLVRLGTYATLGLLAESTLEARGPIDVIKKSWDKKDTPLLHDSVSTAFKRLAQRKASSPQVQNALQALSKWVRRDKLKFALALTDEQVAIIEHDGWWVSQGGAKKLEAGGHGQLVAFVGPEKAGRKKLTAKEQVEALKFNRAKLAPEGADLAPKRVQLCWDGIKDDIARIPYRAMGEMGLPASVECAGADEDGWKIRGRLVVHCDADSADDTQDAVTKLLIRAYNGEWRDPDVVVDDPAFGDEVGGIFA
jgi:hypothetical protein